MKILPKTRTNLWKLAALSDRYQLLLLFSYFEDHGQEAPTQDKIREATKLSKQMIKHTTRALSAVGFITVTTSKGNKKVVNVCNKLGLALAESVSTIISIYSKSSLEEKNDGAKAKPNQTSKSDLKGQWSVNDIRADEDWQKAEAILLKYFRASQINPVYLTKKNNFANLIEAISQLKDFEAYCKWYRIEKYPSKKFYYGLFLYPSMISEYEDAMEDAADSYLNVTSNMENSEGYKKLLEEQEKTLTLELGGDRAKKVT